jgi:cytochrome b involved in lipid metabolism
MSKTFSVAEVAEHKDAEKGMYIIVDENVYDVTGMFFFLSGGF